MRCVVFGLNDNGIALRQLLNLNIQAGVDLTAYFHLPENKQGDAVDKLILYQYHHSVNESVDGHFFEQVEDILSVDQSFDKFYIVGADFNLRQQFLNAGIDCKKFSMCYGNVIDCCCPLDEIFIIPKRQPQIPFKKAPAEIYQQYTGETAKAHARRVREGFFEKYCQGDGLDVGYGADLIVPNASGWDFRNGDAQYLSGIDNETFDFVYSSHCLEHMYDVRTALKNWFRVVKRGGYLLLAIPHRDLYEKKPQLPSRWNGDHKHMFLIGRAEPPDTLDIVEEIRESLSGYDIKYIKACDEGHTITDPLRHSDGEYQIEIVLQKL